MSRQEQHRDPYRRRTALMRNSRKKCQSGRRAVSVRSTFQQASAVDFIEEDDNLSDTYVMNLRGALMYLVDEGIYEVYALG